MADTRIDHALHVSMPCAAQKKPVQSVDKTRHDVTLPIQVSANSAEALLDDRWITLSGDVFIQQGEQTLSADQATYQLKKGDIETSGNVLLTHNGLHIRADQVSYNLQQQTGQAQQASYQIADIPARGKAGKISLLDAAHTQYELITYTTCQNDDWVLSANKLAIDRARGMGTVQNATLSFMDMPILYLPWMSFPIDNRRHSGFLIPTFGYGNKNGLDVSLPYYFNLAPHYDFTFSPRMISKRGLLLGGELRFLTSHTSGALRAEYLPFDDQQDQYAKNRSSFTLHTHSQFSPNLSSRIQIEQVSDDAYFDDLGNNQLNASNPALLQRHAELRYQAADWGLLARLKNYQVLNDGDQPYSLLPQVRLDMQIPGEQSGLTYHLDTEISQFTKNDDALEGARLDIYPAVSLPIQQDYYHLTPKAGTRYTRYALHNQADGADRSPDRLAGIFSLDSGLYFERDTSLFGSAAHQTVEPRLYYLYTTQHNQNDMPLFDTGRYAFSTASLLRENRFNGPDRLGDANQVSLSLTTRYHDDKTGRERLQAGIGQIFYLQDRKVNLPDENTEQDTSSAIAADFSAQINPDWQVRSNLALDLNDRELDQALAQIHYRADNSHLLNLSYRLRDADNEHIGLSTIWPLGGNIRGLAHWRYSLQEQQTREAIAGIEYGTCCWQVRTIVHQHRDTPSDKQDTAFFVQLELNGLAKLGGSMEDLLGERIYGYRRENSL